MSPASSPARYPIRAVSKLTGIGIDTLRAWERRYGAVTPTRDDRGRMYSDADIARLRLISQAVSAGHSVGRVAKLPSRELRHLTLTLPPAETAAPRSALDTTTLRAAIAAFDGTALEREFGRLATLLPPLELVRDVLLPILRQAGEAWMRSRTGIATEHLISSTVRHVLGSSLRLYSTQPGSARLIFATPSGDRHEIGILAAAMLAASSGLSVSYLGPDLPAKEILSAVASARAQVLVLGLTLSAPRPNLQRELRRVTQELPRHVELWSGGAATSRHAKVLSPRGLLLPDLDAYAQQLARFGGRRG